MHHSDIRQIESCLGSFRFHTISFGSSSLKVCSVVLRGEGFFGCVANEWGGCDCEGIANDVLASDMMSCCRVSMPSGIAWLASAKGDMPTCAALMTSEKQGSSISSKDHSRGEYSNKNRNKLSFGGVEGEDGEKL
jgi:hypothetical protein